MIFVGSKDITTIKETFFSQDRNGKGGILTSLYPFHERLNRSTRNYQTAHVVTR